MGIYGIFIERDEVLMKRGEVLMPSIRVSLAIDKDELLRWYSGGAQNVSTLATDGRRVQFPVEVLRPYVAYNGVFGYFEIQFSEEGRFLSIKKM